MIKVIIKKIKNNYGKSIIQIHQGLLEIKMIEGVKISELKVISDKRGKIMHMMRTDSPVFKKFGEIYFSTIYKNIIKFAFISYINTKLCMY